MESEDAAARYSRRCVCQYLGERHSLFRTLYSRSRPGLCTPSSKKSVRHQARTEEHGRCMSSFASPYVVLPFPDLVGIGDRLLMGESLLWLLRRTLHRCGAPFRVLSLLDRWLFLSWNPSPRAADRGSLSSCGAAVAMASYHSALGLVV